MKQNAEKRMPNAQAELYEAPRVEVIEMEIEGPILQFSGENGKRQGW